SNHTREPPKRTALMSPIGTAFFLQSVTFGSATGAHDAPASTDRSTSPPSPTAYPVEPENSMSFNATPPGARVCVNEPSEPRVYTPPDAVVNQNREADWYSIAVMFDVVPL